MPPGDGRRISRTRLGRGGADGLRQAACRGFTLIELAAVIAILGIMAVSVGGPTLSGIQDIRTRTAAARLLTDIRYVQRLALSSGQRSWVLLDAASDSYTLYIEDASNLGKANRIGVEHPYDQSTNAIQFGSGVFAGVGISAVNINATSEIEFDNFGVPYDANGAALTATGSISLTSGVTITVHPVSGFAE